MGFRLGEQALQLRANRRDGDAVPRRDIGQRHAFHEVRGEARLGWGQSEGMLVTQEIRLWVAFRVDDEGGQLNRRYGFGPSLRNRQRIHPNEVESTAAVLPDRK